MVSYIIIVIDNENNPFLYSYLSPRKCVENLILGTEVAAEDLGQNRCMMMPGRAWSIQQLVDAMTKVAGPEPAKLIKWQEDADIQAIVNGWRYDMNAQKARRLGLSADDSFEDNVRYYIEDDRVMVDPFRSFLMLSM